MSKLSCPNCSLQFTRRSSYHYHVNNKVCEKGQKYRCENCNKTFMHKNSMYRHMKNYCTSASTDNDNKSDDTDDLDKKELFKKFSEMEERMRKLENENKTLKSEKSNSLNKGTIVNGNVHNGNIHNGDINTMNLTINIVPFGKEDLSRINKNDLLKVFRSGFNSALQLTETTHFNPKYPEYHNVYISNMKNKYAMTYDGSDWALVMKDELIDKMYTKKRDYIEDNMEDFINSLMPSQINALHRWLAVEDDHHYVQKVKNDMKLMLYNKRKMALDPKPPQVTDVDEVDYTVRVIKEPKHDVSEPKVIKSVRIASRNGRYRKTIARRRKAE